MAPYPASTKILTEDCQSNLSSLPQIVDQVTGKTFYGSISDESDLIIPSKVLKVYGRRWLVLMIFSLLAFNQSLVWITWSSISSSAKDVFGWSDTTIALLVDWGNIPFVVMLFPVCWLLDAKGLRIATLASTVLMFFGTAMRCITSETAIATPLIHLGQILNGIAGVVFTSAPSQLSAAWFPSHQRTTATSIAILCNYMGISFGYIFGPTFVHHIAPSPCANTSHQEHCGNITLEHIRHQRHQIMNLMYGECVAAAILLVVAIFYFPKHPPLPPTPSANEERIHLRLTFKKLFRNVNFWFVVLGFGVTNAIGGNWLSILGPAMEPFHLSQTMTGQMGSAATFVGSLLSVFMARLVDHLGGRIKTCLVIMWAIGCINYVWYTLLFLNIVTPTLARVYPSVMITGVMAYTGTPLYMELAVEVAYPVNEGVVGTFLQCTMNTIGSVFLTMFLIPDIGISWINWCLIGSAVVGIFCAVIQKEKYNRLDLDRSAKQKYEAITP